jgi:preprotein translocase subunit SecB
MIIWDKAHENNKLFRLEIMIRGIFSADDSVKEDFTYLCEYNGLSILFPFIRSAIADITEAANVSPLILPLINVENFINKHKQKENN